LISNGDRLLKIIDESSDPVAVLREYYLADFFAFAKHCIGFKDLEWEVHREMIMVCESSATRKLVVEPRGSFKTSLCGVAYPIWKYLKNPDITILLDSELYTNSKNTLREIKGHLMSDGLTKVFGPQIGAKWDESEIICAGRTRVRKEATFTVGGIGTTKVGQHYDEIIGDDYNSPDNSDTPEKCEKVISHIRYNMNILNPGGEYLFIGTRYAERDASGFLLAEVLGERYLAEGKLERFHGKIDEENELLGA
jgi:hypothetical protein